MKTKFAVYSFSKALLLPNWAPREVRSSIILLAESKNDNAWLKTSARQFDWVLKQFVIVWLKGHDRHFVIVPLCYNLHMNGRSLLMWKSKRWVLKKNANMRNIFEFTQTEKVWDEAAYPLNISRVSSGTFQRKYHKKKQDMDTQGIQKVPGCFMNTHTKK